MAITVPGDPKQRRVPETGDRFYGEELKRTLILTVEQANALERRIEEVATGAEGGDLRAENNLSDLPDKAAARQALDVYSKAETEAYVAAHGGSGGGLPVLISQTDPGVAAGAYAIWIQPDTEPPFTPQLPDVPPSE